ncbi:MAG TPA: toprim domain-containing protein, partial [Propionicimonas sp.]
SLLTEPIAPKEPDETLAEDEPPADLWEGYIPTDAALSFDSTDDELRADETATSEEPTADVELTAEAALMIEAMIRNSLGVPEPTDADIRRMQDRANAWHNCPATPERLAHINELSLRYFERCFTESWARGYLIERFGQDLAGSSFRPGYAPDGWTGLVTHLRRQGVTDQEMLASGVAATASTGRLIDRFRDRVVFPITHDGQTLGFVGRRNPAYADDDRHGPKYFNTPDTPLFHKGAQLYAAGHPASEATPVLVEGPMDALAVTLASEGRHIGLAPLGTSLTGEQAAQLHALGRTPVVATDADPAGRTAAERDFWILASYGIDPLHARLPDGRDPADLIAAGESGQLVAAVTSASPLSDTLIDERFSTQPESEAALDALRVVSAQRSAQWTAGVERIADRSQVPSALLRSALVPLVRAWNIDPNRAAQRATTRRRPPDTHAVDNPHTTLQSRSTRRPPENSVPAVKRFLGPPR